MTTILFRAASIVFAIGFGIVTLFEGNYYDEQNRTLVGYAAPQKIAHR